MIFDAGFAQSVEVMYVDEAELQSLDAEEWALLQRLITEPVSLPITTLECRTLARGVLQITLRHDIPRITQMTDELPFAKDTADDQSYFTFPRGGYMNFNFTTGNQEWIL